MAKEKIRSIWNSAIEYWFAARAGISQDDTEGEIIRMGTTNTMLYL